MHKKISTRTDGGRKSGRAVFDNQGRASWEWQTATGVFQANVKNEQMVGLETAGLALLDSEATKPAVRVWTNAATSSSPLRATRVTPDRNPTVLKRLMRRLAG